jgi:hypothetical protein
MKKLAKSLWKILIIAVFVNFTACIKIENSKPEIYKIIDDNSLLIESYKLKIVHDDIIKQIIEIDQAIKLEWLNSFDFNNVLVNENLGTYLSKAKTKEEILLAYSLNGVTNGNKLFSLIEKKLNLFKSFINKYDSLQLLSSNDVNFIIKYAFIYNLKNSFPSKIKSMSLENNCITAYKNGIADCDEDYQSALADSFATTVFMLFTGGPFYSIVNFTYTAFKAVSNYNSCNFRISRNFTNCINAEKNAL